MTQAVWATAHGHPLEVTGLTGEQFTRLGAHFDPILVLLAPLWWIWPSPSTAAASSRRSRSRSARCRSTGSARKHLGSERAALGFALVYLLTPAVGWMTLSEFHPVALATPLLLYAVWYLDEDRLVAFAVVRRARRRDEGARRPRGRPARRLVRALAPAALPGLAIAAAGVAVSALAVAVVIPHYRPAGGARLLRALRRDRRVAAAGSRGRR